MHEFSVTPIAPFGAEVRGLDDDALPDPESLQVLRDLLDEHGLLVFPDAHVDYEFQVELTALLVRHEDRLEKELVDGVPLRSRKPSFVSNRQPKAQAPFGRLLFHSDMMWSDDPCHALSLYGFEVESPAVPTVFASTTSAWESLPAELRSRVENLTARHLTGTKMRGGDDPDLLMSTFAEDISTTAPIKCPHPRSGKSMLFVSEGNTQEIVGLDPDESEALLGTLFEYLYAPANRLEHVWRQSDLVVWDNLAVQHARANVRTDGPARTLRKVFSPVEQKVTAEALQYSRLE
jgi:taurine dioxygenase